MNKIQLIIDIISTLIVYRMSYQNALGVYPNNVGRSDTQMSVSFGGKVVRWNEGIALDQCRCVAHTHHEQQLSRLSSLRLKVCLYIGESSIQMHHAFRDNALIELATRYWVQVSRSGNLSLCDKVCSYVLDDEALEAVIKVVYTQNFRVSVESVRHHQALHRLGVEVGTSHSVRD